jgi:ABC-type enterochelin transport system substrate-binding protein
MNDQQLARLFEQRDRAQRNLDMIDARIKAARNDYAQRNGLLMLPSVDSMRKAVSHG